MIWKTWMGSGPGGGWASVLSAAFLVVALIVLVYSTAVSGRKILDSSHADKFYTVGGATEFPTRSYTPYTGTIPAGPWGTRPFAEQASMGGC